MAHDHHHGHAAANERALWQALGLTTAFLVTEVIGGIVSGSLALLSDAAHMFTDTAALAIALAAIRIARRPADDRRSFGYHRFEILAAAFNAVLLFLVAIYILVEASQRLREPPGIHSGVMLAVAAIGLVVNLLCMRILSSGKDASLNLKGAYLEVWSDLLGSLGVIAGAVVIRLTGWSWVDSAIAVAIGLWVLPRTWRLLHESLNVLLEGVPQEIELGQVQAALASFAGVAGIHDLHIWSIASGKTSLTVHAVADASVTDPYELVVQLRTLLAERFDIHHATVQVERIACEQAGDAHGFGPGTGEAAHAH